MEDKQLICDLLLKTLQATRDASDLVSLLYDPEKEVVYARFEGPGVKLSVINLVLDSGTEMIRDIMNQLGV